MNKIFTYIFGILIILLPSAVFSVEIEFGLPDSLSDLNSWAETGYIAVETEHDTAQMIQNFQVIPGNNMVGETSAHVISFEVPESGIPYYGGVSLKFPAVFDLSDIYDIEYSDDHPGQDPEPWLLFIYDNYITLIFKRDNSPPNGATVEITVSDIKNPTASGNYAIAGMIFNRWLRVVAGPSISEFFTINPGPIVSYDLVQPDPHEEKAGHAYRIYALNAMDQYGNPSNGIIEVEPLGDLTSPSGHEPIINDIIVQNGVGSAGQVVYKVGPALFSLIIDTLYKEFGYDVLPGIAQEANLELQPTQFHGHEIKGPASISIYDEYGNAVDDFDVRLPQNVLLTSNIGSFSPNTIPNTDFIDGVADLSDKNILFEGDPGPVTVYARFENIAGEIITSNEIEVFYNGIVMHLVYPLCDTIYFGESYHFRTAVLNNGNLSPISPSLVKGYFQSCEQTCIQSKEFYTLEPGDTEIFLTYFSTDIFTPLDDELFFADIESNYFYENDTIEIHQTIQQVVSILPPLEIGYIPGSLTIDTIYSGTNTDSFSVEFSLPENHGFEYPEIYFDHIYIEYLNNQWRKIYSPLRTQVFSDNVFRLTYAYGKVPLFDDIDGVTSGYKCLKVSGYIEDGRRQVFFKTSNCFDSLFLVVAANLSYTDNSLSPTTAYAATPQKFEFDIILEGYTTITVDPMTSRLELLYDEELLPGFLSDTITLKPGNNRIKTRDIYIPEYLVGFELTPRLILSGTEIYAQRVDTILFGDDVIMVDEHTAVEPQLKITSTELLTVNPPYVNHSQQFSVEVTVVNASDVPIDSVTIYMQSENGAVIFDSVSNISLSAFGTYEAIFIMIAPDISSPSVIYKAVAVSPLATVLPPDDNTAAITVQSPARLELDYALQNTSGNYVDYGQPFSIIAWLDNYGEAKTGLAEISLIVDEYDFGVPDSSAKTTTPDSLVADWNLIAPTSSINTELRLRLTGVPIDINTGQPAIVTIDSKSIPITVEPSSAELIVNGVANPNSLIIEGDEKEVFQLDLTNNTQNPINIVGLRSITIQTTNRHKEIISPDKILSIEESGFYMGDDNLTSSEIYDGRLKLIFNNFDLNANEKTSIVFRAKFNDRIDIEGFTISIDSRDIRAVFTTGPRINQSVPVMGEYSNVFQLNAHFVIMTPDLKESFRIRNNPFNPDEGPAEFSYYLENATDVGLTIYTLTGEKVFEILYPSGTNGGAAGANCASWDGANDEGHQVLNGVYIVIISPASSEETYKLKIAVLR